MTVGEALKRYGLSRDTLYRWNREGRLAFYKEIGVKQTLVRENELEIAIRDWPARGRPRRKAAG